MFTDHIAAIEIRNVEIAHMFCVAGSFFSNIEVIKATVQHGLSDIGKRKGSRKAD